MMDDEFSPEAINNAVSQTLGVKAPKLESVQTNTSDLNSEDINRAVLEAVKPSTTITAKPQAQHDKTITDYFKGVGRGLASLGDVTVGGVLPIAGQVVQAAARPFTTPQRAQEIGGAVSSAIDQPFGKAFGVTETPEYKQETSRSLMDFVGKYANLGAEKISELTGGRLPVEDVQNMLGTLTIPAGKALGIGGKAIGSEAKMVSDALKSKFAGGKTPQAIMQDLHGAEVSDLAGVGAAKSDMNPYSSLTGEEKSRGQYPIVKLSKIAADVPVSEQKTRSQIANKVLGENNLVRTGVLTGNEDTLRNEYTEAKKANPTPKGELLKEQIANEQNALSDFSQKLVNDTGASQTLTSPYERGQRIADALIGDEGLKGFFKAEKNKIYEEAKKQVGDNPIGSQTVENLINSPQFKAELKIKGIPEFTNGVKELLDLHKTEGLQDTTPNSLAGLEKIRQSLNAQWSPANSYGIGQVINAIDADIAKAGGPGLYERGRKVHQAEKVLFGSKGIKSMFGEVDPNGVQTGTPYEKIPDKLNQMPVDEWKHIHDTLELISKGKIRGKDFELDIPEELKTAAISAKNEMLGNIAREVYEQGANKVGVWNQNSANKVLNARAEKIKHGFSPEAQQDFHTLNYAGHIMPGVHHYEGAALQARRLGLIEGHIEKAATGAGAAAGGAIAGPLGAGVGGYLTGKAGAKVAQSLESKALAKEAENLRNEMKANAKLGTKIKDLNK